MHVLLVTGSLPPEFCGIGDYTAVLARHLQEAGVRVEFFHTRDWRLHRLPAIASAIRARGADIVHMQYPTLGYGRSLVPSLVPLLARAAPFVVTLHEFSVFRKLRRPWFVPFALAARMIVFTTETERDRFRRFAPWKRAGDTVIPIGSNIPAGVTRARDPLTVTYFGQINPLKGLDEFIGLARLGAARGAPYRFRILGGIPARYRGFADGFLATARAAGIELVLDRPAEEVADILANTAFAYQPYEDGASTKRGSLLASLVNGVIVLAPYGPQTSDWLKEVVVEAATPDAALAALDRLAGDEAGNAARHARVAAAAQRVDWRQIAQRQIAVYRDLLAPR
jgi:glycosyltransferase involved in cell wall biosynthesis